MKIALWAAGLLALSCQVSDTSASAAEDEGASDADVYYNLSDDPDRMQLLGLSTIEGEDSHTTVDIVDLYRNPTQFGFVNTWLIDCVHSQMSIIKAMQLEPGYSGKPTEITGGEVMSTTSSPKSRRIAELVCTGHGQLQKQRVYQAKLAAIVMSFWGP